MSDKRHDPTNRRLERARARGDVALAPILIQSAGLCAALVVLPGMLAALVHYFRSSFRRALTSPSLEVSARGLIGDVLMFALPVIIAASAAALAAGLIQTRGSFALRRPSSDAKRNPFSASVRSFSSEAPGSLGVALFAGVVVAVAAIWVLQSHAVSLRNTVGSTRTAAALAGVVSLQLAWLVAALTSGIGLAHLTLASRARWRRLRMSEAEVRRELRDNQGDPTLRSARRRTHRELIEPSGPASSQTDSRTK